MIVYIDQRHWIDLARVESGHPEGKPYMEIHERLRSLTTSGQVVLPLSAVHMLETSHTGNAERRNNVARTIARFSRGYSIAPLDVAVRTEIEARVRAHYGSGHVDPQANAIQRRGPYHALGIDGAGLPGSPENDILAMIEDPSRLQAAIGMGVSPSDREAARELEAAAVHTIEQGPRERARNAHVKRDILRQHNERDAYRHLYLPSLAVALAQPDVTGTEAPRPDSWPLELMSVEMMTTIAPIDVWIATTVERDYAWNRGIEPNDLRDQGFLATAVPYCDVVLADNYWRDAVNRQHLGKRYNTIVLGDLNDLGRILDEHGL